jgi:hypothetical protein
MQCLRMPLYVCVGVGITEVDRQESSTQRCMLVIDYVMTREGMSRKWVTKSTPSITIYSITIIITITTTGVCSYRLDQYYLEI